MSGLIWIDSTKDGRTRGIAAIWHAFDILRLIREIRIRTQIDGFVARDTECDFVVID